jgi:hypothetical protein
MGIFVRSPPFTTPTRKQPGFSPPLFCHIPPTMFHKSTKSCCVADELLLHVFLSENFPMVLPHNAQPYTPGICILHAASTKQKHKHSGLLRTRFRANNRSNQCERLVTVVPPGSKLPAIWQSWSYLFATARCAQQKHEWRATSMVPHGAQCQKLRGLGLLKRLGHRHSHFVGAAVPVSSLSSSFTIVKPILGGSTPWYCRPQTYYRNVSREVLVLEVAAKNLDVEAVLRLPT